MGVELLIFLLIYNLITILLIFKSTGAYGDNVNDLCTNQDPLGYPNYTATVHSNYFEMNSSYECKVDECCNDIRNSYRVNAGQSTLNNPTSTYILFIMFWLVHFVA